MKILLLLGLYLFVLFVLMAPFRLSGIISQEEEM